MGQSTNAWTLAGTVLERPRSEEQERKERAMLRGAWEMASVLEFLEVFHVQLGLPRRCSAADLEAALVLSPGGPGVLADLHLVCPHAPCNTTSHRVSSRPHVAWQVPTMKRRVCVCSVHAHIHDCMWWFS